MIEIIEYTVPMREYWTVMCPHCSAPLEFHVACCMYCFCCKQLLPPFHLLVDEDPDFAQEARLEYYKKGQKWIEGDY